jgi:hypothetical protein
MKSSTNRKAIASQKSNSRRHESHCNICAHPQCEEIEREFISWKSPVKIAAEFKLGDRSSVYRHAHALGLFAERGGNLRLALGRLIERVDEVPVTAGAVVQAIALYARINGRGELIDPGGQERLDDLYAKMNSTEKEAFAKDGTFPSWFPRLAGAKGSQGSGGNENE